MVSIREADVTDAGACSKVLCASIIELCTADHNDDEAVIAKWTANKTPDSPQADMRITCLHLGQHRRTEIAADNVADTEMLYTRNQHADACSNIEHPVARR